MIRGLIFDFDGLILDTEGPIYQSWLELFQDHGAELRFDVWASIIGTSNIEHFDPFQLLEETVGQSLDHETLAPLRYTRELELCHAQPILPGVIGKIERAKKLGLKLGVASSSNRDWVAGHLSRLGLACYFDVVHTSDDVKRTKPDPSLFLLTLASLDLQPGEAIVFEDSPNGVTAAKRAGIFAVAVPNDLTRRLSLEHADLKLHSLAELSLDEIIAKTNHT